MRIVELALDTGTEAFSDLTTPSGQAMLPIVRSINLAPTRLRPGQGLGERGTVRVVLQDFADGAAGTYLGKLIADNPYYLDRVMTIKVGYLAEGGFDANDFSSRTYFIDAIDGPDDRGFVTITARDALKNLYASGAKVPAVTRGALVSSLTNSATGLVDVGDVDGYPASGYVIIDDEILAYSSVSGTQLNISGRAQFGTTADAHDAEAPARAVYVFETVNPVDAIETLLTDFGNIDASYIPSADWAQEKTDYLNLYTLYGVVREPTPVRAVVNKICQYCSINLWWDERDQEVKLKAYGPQLASDFYITDNNLLNGERAKVERDLDSRASQVWYFHSKRDHSKGDDQKNFGELHIDADPSLEDASKYGKAAVKQILAEFVNSAVVAGGVSSRLLERLKNGTTKIRFSLDAKDSDIWTGDIGTLETNLIQQGSSDPDPGEPKPIQIIITSVTEEDGHVYSYEAQLFKAEPPLRYARIGPNTLADYTAESAANHNSYAFISDNTPAMSNGDSAYYIL